MCRLRTRSWTWSVSLQWHNPECAVYVPGIGLGQYICNDTTLNVLSTYQVLALVSISAMTQSWMCRLRTMSWPWSVSLQWHNPECAVYVPGLGLGQYLCNDTTLNVPSTYQVLVSISAMTQPWMCRLRTRYYWTWSVSLQWHNPECAVYVPGLGLGLYLCNDTTLNVPSTYQVLVCISAMTQPWMCRLRTRYWTWSVSLQWHNPECAVYVPGIGLGQYLCNDTTLNAPSTYQVLVCISAMTQPWMCRLRTSSWPWSVSLQWHNPECAVYVPGLGLYLCNDTTLNVPSTYQVLDLVSISAMTQPWMCRLRTRYWPWSVSLQWHNPECAVYVPGLGLGQYLCNDTILNVPSTYHVLALVSISAMTQPWMCRLRTRSWPWSVSLQWHNPECAVYVPGLGLYLCNDTTLNVPSTYQVLDLVCISAMTQPWMCRLRTRSWPWSVSLQWHNPECAVYVPGLGLGQYLCNDTTLNVPSTYQVLALVCISAMAQPWMCRLRTRSWSVSLQWHNPECAVYVPGLGLGQYLCNDTTLNVPSTYQVLDLVSISAMTQPWMCRLLSRSWPWSVSLQWHNPECAVYVPGLGLGQYLCLGIREEKQVSVTRFTSVLTLRVQFGSWGGFNLMIRNCPH